MDHTPAEALPKTSRRRFLKRTAMVVVAGGLATAGYTWRVEPHWLEIVDRPLPIAHLPAEMGGKRLVQTSDLHIGPTVDDDYMATALQKVSALRADLVAITGDFMSCHASEEVPHVLAMLQNLQPARLATVALL